MLLYLHNIGKGKKFMDFLNGVLLFLEGLSNFFGIFSTTHSTISTNWSFGKALADFATWLIGFGGKIAAFFA